MAYIKIPKGWETPENQVTSESDYMDRRKFIKDLGDSEREYIAHFKFKRVRAEYRGRKAVGALPCAKTCCRK